VVVTTGEFAGAPERRTLVIDMPSTFYFHREADGLLMGMGGADDDPSFDTVVDDAFLAERLLPTATRVFPPVQDAGVRSTWVGLYEMTPDRHPVVGATSVEGVVVAAGFSGHGFQHGPIVGKVVAEVVVGGRARSVDVSALTADRFDRGASIAERHVV
jgi:sarcosine oxidase, subunit beta